PLPQNKVRTVTPPSDRRATLYPLIDGENTMTMPRWLLALTLAAGLGFLPAAAAASPTVVAAADKADPGEVSRPFAHLAKLPDVPWTCLHDGCYARAERAVEELEKLGFHPRKIWAFPSGPEPLWVATPRAAKGFVEWTYHVAPVVPVRLKNGK